MSTEFDKPDQIWGYIHRLDILTLLGSSINSSVCNGVIGLEQVALRQSDFLLTKSLGNQIKVGGRHSHRSGREPPEVVR